MSRFPDRTKTALLVIDVQRGVVAGSHNRAELIKNLNDLVSRAREAQAPVIWVQHSDESLPEGSEQWQLVEELTPREDEPLVHKSFGDSFAETDLEAHLQRLGVGHLVVTGAQTDACIRSSLHSALTRGYDTTLVADAHATEDMRQWGSPVSPEQAIAYTNLYWSFSRTHEATGATSPTAEISFTASGESPTLPS